MWDNAPARPNDRPWRARGRSHGLADMLMQAFHASRRRQAERELQYYQHLVDRKPSGPSRAESGKSIADQSPPHRLTARRIATVLAIALLTVLASLQIVGGILIASRSVSSASESITLRGD